MYKDESTGSNGHCVCLSGRGHRRKSRYTSLLRPRAQWFEVS